MASGKSLLQLRELAQLAKSSLSTQTAAASKMVKPPVPMFGVDGRYATALYSAASKKNKLDAVDKNLKTLLGLQQKDTKFREFLINPLIKVCTTALRWPKNNFNWKLCWFLYLTHCFFLATPKAWNFGQGSCFEAQPRRAHPEPHHCVVWKWTNEIVSIGCACF